MLISGSRRRKSGRENFPHDDMRPHGRVRRRPATKSKGETDDQGQEFLERKSILGNKKNQASSKHETCGGSAQIFFVFSEHTGNPLHSLRSLTAIVHDETGSRARAGQSTLHPNDAYPNDTYPNKGKDVRNECIRAPARLLLSPVKGKFQLRFLVGFLLATGSLAIAALIVRSDSAQYRRTQAEISNGLVTSLA